MSITVTLEGVEELERAWENAVIVIQVGARNAVQRAVEEGAAEARAKHAFTNRTGELEASIVGRMLGSESGEGSTIKHVGEIRAGKFYASWVEDGRGPITAKGKALRFEIGGTVFFRKSVKASQPKPFMGIAYIKAERVLQREIEAAIPRAQALLDR